MAAKKRASGPSGVNLNPRYTLRATQQEFDAWAFVADQEGETLSAWIREACNKEAQFVGKELKPTPKSRKKRGG